MATGVFATAITCIDGRTQTPVGEWVKQNAHADFVDTVTWAGVDGVLTSGDADIAAHIRDAVEISVKAHGSAFVALAGHYECAAYSGDRERHLAAIRAAVDIVSGWNLGAKVVGLWVNDQWQIEVVAYGGAS